MDTPCGRMERGRLNLRYSTRAFMFSCRIICFVHFLDRVGCLRFFVEFLQAWATTLSSLRKSKHGLAAVNSCLQNDVTALVNVLSEKDFDVNRKYEPLQMTLLHIICKRGISPSLLLAICPKIDCSSRDKVRLCNDS